MSMDQLDDLVTRQLHATAPREAPGGMLDGVLDRIADTPQGRRGWQLGRAGGLLAAAAVVILAVVVGTQLAGLANRPIGIDPSPSPSAVPSATSSQAVPSASPSAQPPSPVPTEPAVAEDGLLLRVVSFGGGPTDPASLLPWATLMADGTIIWRPADDEFDLTGYVTRKLTPDGLSELRQHIFGDGLLDADATHQLEPLPDVEPPGRGVAVHTFTVGEGADTVVVNSVQWLGDEEEAAYYHPAPERQALDALARQLRDPESLVREDAWEGPAAAYEAPDYQLVIRTTRDAPPYGNPDVADIPIPFEGALDEYGVEIGDPEPPADRCGVISRDEAAAIVDALTELGFAETDSVGLDRATFASPDWADGNGVVSLYLFPRMPDGYPECGDQL